MNQVSGMVFSFLFFVLEMDLAEMMEVGNDHSSEYNIT